MPDVSSIERCLESHGSFTYTNVGRSMLPLLRQGRDVFTVVSKGRGRCRRGDVVLFRRPPSSWVLHRVVRVLPDGYLTLGDNSLSRERVPEGDVVAVLRSVVRDGRAHEVDGPALRLYTAWVLSTEPVRLAVLRARALVGAAVRAVRGIGGGSRHA